MEWEAGLEARETLSELVRGAVDRELDRRRKQVELEEKRQAADPFGLDALLERARRGA